MVESTPLYKIDEQLAKLLALDDGRAVDEETGEIWTPEMLDGLSMARDEKIEQCLMAAKNYLAFAKSLSEEKKQIDARQKAAENTAARIIKYVANSLKGDKFTTPRVAVSWRTVEKTVVDEAAIAKLPQEYLVYGDPRPDKKAIKAAIKGGIELPGCTVVVEKSMSVK